MTGRLMTSVSLGALLSLSVSATGWEGTKTAPVGEPVLVIVPGRDAPVVAICDSAGDWQVAWNGDLLFGATLWAPIPDTSGAQAPTCPSKRCPRPTSEPACVAPWH